jgi:streptomycin 6-kinase
VRRPRFTNRLLEAADLCARKVARDVLHHPDQPLAEELIGLAMWLESLASWKREENSRQRERQNSRNKALRRDSNCPGGE